jgi:hypothetical protein
MMKITAQKLEVYGPVDRWQTRYGQWVVPCAGGCGHVVVRPENTKMKAWICDRCAYPAKGGKR